MHCTKFSRGVGFKRVCNRSKSALERLFDNEDFEVGTMLYDGYKRIFEIVLNGADGVVRIIHCYIKRGNVEARNVDSLGPPTTR